jgi:hypothetical protein
MTVSGRATVAILALGAWVVEQKIDLSVNGSYTELKAFLPMKMFLS